MNEHNMEVLTNIIGGVESGGQVYGKRDYAAYAEPYKNSIKEDTVTLGWAQNYGEEAELLIKMIFNQDPNKFMMIDEGGIVENMLFYDWVKIKWYPSQNEKETLIKLITSPIGKQCQDDLFKERMSNYILDCKRDYTSDPMAIIMYCEIRHLGGKGPVDRIFKRCNLDYELDSIMYSLSQDQLEDNKNMVGSEKFWSRHRKCSEWAAYYIEEEEVMTESDITICGHGSANPSLKNLKEYNEKRYSSIATNGKHRGLIEVRRLKEMNDTQRAQFHDFYTKILNRNIYSQDLREYCYKTYQNGYYYSDCSSSGIKTFEKCGFKFPWTYNTALIHSANEFETVHVNIVNGHVQNPEILKIGDCLLYVGNDPSRPLQIGHVEYIYEIKGETKETYPKWVQSGDDWYYRLAEGTNAHGWLKIPETTDNDNIHWYYFDEKGKMATDWLMIEGKWYYFQPSGSLQGALYHESDKKDGSLEIWYV